VSEPIGRALSGDYFALPGLLKLTPAAALCYLRALILSQLVEDAVRELSLRALVSPIVEGTDLRSMLLELAPEKVMVGGLAGEPITVLGQHHIDTTTRYEFPHTVHTWPLQAGAALSGVYYFL